MAKELKPTDGFFAAGWMVTQLHLTGSEMMAFALVHQFSQSNAGVYIGGPGYLQQWLGCAENTARKYLHTLLEKGLIINEDQEVNGVLFRHYRVNYDTLQKFTLPLKNLPTPPQNLRVEYNKNNTPKGVNISIPPTPFNFRQSLIGLGVEVEVVDAWLQVRKAKKGVNTKIAFAAIEKEILQAGQNGHSANECIRLAVEKSWAGFKWEWMENELSGRSTRPAAAGNGKGLRKGGTAVDRMLAVGAELFGQKAPMYDEQ